MIKQLPELYKGEELRPIDEEGFYLISNYGRVWSTRTGKWMGKHNGQLFDIHTKVYFSYNGYKSNMYIGYLVELNFGAGHGNEYYMRALWRKYNND